MVREYSVSFLRGFGRYVAATASREAAGMALQMQLNLAAEQSCIEAEDMSWMHFARHVSDVS